MKLKSGWFVLLGIALLLLSCGGKKVNLDPKVQSDSQLYEMAKKYSKEGDKVKAREAFKVVFENFPKSDYRILAKLGYADSYYDEGAEASYVLAIQEYQDFISLFPFSPKAEYAQYQIGMCYYHMTEKPDRDQSNTRKALDEFRKVVDNYPNGEYFKKAYDSLLFCYTKLAEHEFTIARFYQKTGHHQAAVDRLKALLKTYPESIYQPKFYFSLAQSLQELNQYSESCTYYENLLQRWPTSEFTSDAKQARAKVCKAGKQPSAS